MRGQVGKPGAPYLGCGGCGDALQGSACGGAPGRGFLGGAPLEGCPMGVSCRRALSKAWRL